MFSNSTGMLRTESSQTSNISSIFQIVAEEVGISVDELSEDNEFTDLGLDDFLAKSTLSKVAEKTGLQLPNSTFNDHPTVGSLRSHLQDSLEPSVDVAENVTKVDSSSPASAVPLSITLQGSLKSAKSIFFLLPDGSGAAMAYLKVPIIDPSVCVIGMNSPFLRAGDEGTFSVEGIAAVWAKEIRRQQPKGPYTLGGWSAGGYYSFEVAKYLIRMKEKVKKLVLIDSPSRLVYEELPMEVVQYLSKNNLMGNWGTEGPPSWMVNHFRLSIRAISEYVPAPMKHPDIPEVFIVSAEDGVLKNVDAIETGLDLNVKVTRMLLLRPDRYEPLGWNELFPGVKLSVANMPGNHFTMVHPPHCQSLSLLLRDFVQDHEVDRKCLWYKL